MYSTPMIGAGVGTPPIPSGLKLATTPPGIPYPVLQWGNYVYWPLSYLDNRAAMAVVAYDESNRFVQLWTQDGAQAVSGITVSVPGQTVTFAGANAGQIVMPWENLVVTPRFAQVNTVAQPPSIPSGLRLSPNAPANAYPVVQWGEYTYWPFSYGDGRASTAIVAYDHLGNMVRLWNVSGVAAVQSVAVDPQAETVVLNGAGGPATIGWDTLDIAYTTCYQASVDDLVAVAAAYGLPLTQQDAVALAAALPMFSCANCGMHAKPNLAARSLSAGGFWSGAVGSIVGGIIGAAAGALIGGPMGAIAGFTIGSAVGLQIGINVDLNPPTYIYTPGSLEVQTFVYMSSFPIGPFPNTGLRENLFDLPFPRYGQIDVAGAVAPPVRNMLQVYYPTQGKILGPILGKYPPYRTPQGNVYKFIFVIVQVPNESKGGQPAYQLRIHPEDFYPDTIRASDRVNHSQLSEGTRFAALLGQDSMQVYAAGSLYLLNGQIMGIDSRTGHYYWSFNGKDQADIDATLGLLQSLGYQTSTVLQWSDLVNFLNGQM
jgi:hypothetical protein